MIITKHSIQNIKFPVYKMPAEGYEIKDGIVWSLEGKVIDDTNQLGATLGTRRLQTPFKTKRLTVSFPSFVALLRAGSRNTLIDSNGTIFNYRKEGYEYLRSHKIKSIKLNKHYCVLRLHGVNTPIMTKSRPGPGAVYASVLYLQEHPWLIYNYTDEPIVPTRRKV